jgi:hypothetical protein
LERPEIKIRIIAWMTIRKDVIINGCRIKQKTGILKGSGQCMNYSSGLYPETEYF